LPNLTIRNLSSSLVGPFDFVVEAGECLAISGPSGSGKSLLLRMIADLDPNEGQVALGELNREQCDAPQWRRHVTYVAADAGWWADAVAEHFAPETLEAAKRLGERLALKAELFEGPVSRLSMGEKQRLALIRALVKAPSVLLLDEPTSSLDQDSVARTEAVLEERLAEGLILVVVTHDPGQAERLGDRRFEMRNGRLGAP
jgi:UDP-glucose/iron transport system ATP-binding protein